MGRPFDLKMASPVFDSQKTICPCRTLRLHCCCYASRIPLTWRSE